MKREPFLIFTSVSKAKNYVKRHPGHHYEDGCGCCSHYDYYSIDGSLVVRKYGGEHMGSPYMSVKVIGRVR
jgi:hypothetical protein